MYKVYSSLQKSIRSFLQLHFQCFLANNIGKLFVSVYVFISSHSTAFLFVIRAVYSIVFCWLIVLLLLITLEGKTHSLVCRWQSFIYIILDTILYKIYIIFSLVSISFLYITQLIVSSLLYLFQVSENTLLYFCCITNHPKKVS